MGEKILTIKDLISEAGKHLRSEFESIKATNPHYGERGAEAEKILEDFLNNHLPKRFAAGSGLVIDQKNQISLQSDVLIYDALNSPIYRKGQNVLIIPSDNVAGVIEVKSSLSKAELEDAAKKISSVKKLEKLPITNIDQPVTFSSLITTKTLGIVFAYDSKTSLQTLADNLKEINQKYPSEEWIDMVVVLDKGVIGYVMQNPFSDKFEGWFGGSCGNKFPVAPMYVNLIKSDLGELTLNQFFVNLMAHLTFYRKRTTLVFESVMGKDKGECMMIQGYQHDLKRKLVPVEKNHLEGNLLPSLEKYNLYAVKDGVYVGQIIRMPWQDGSALVYSGRFGPPRKIFQPYFKAVNQEDGLIVPGMEGGNHFMTSVIPLSKEQFKEVSERIKGAVIAKYYKGDEPDIKDFPNTLEKYEKLMEKQKKDKE